MSECFRKNINHHIYGLIQSNLRLSHFIQLGNWGLRTSLCEITCIWKLYLHPCDWTQLEHCCRFSPFLCLDHRLSVRPPACKPQVTVNAWDKKKFDAWFLWRINDLGKCSINGRVVWCTLIQPPQSWLYPFISVKNVIYYNYKLSFCHHDLS